MIRLALPSLPPSSNHAYFNLRTGGRSLSDVGRAYKRDVTTRLQREYRKEMMFFQKNAPYLLLVRFFFETLTNKGYPEKTATRYKRLDGSNRLKLLEDALKDAAGIDDSQFLQTFWEKKVAPTERTELWVWDLEAESTPFHESLRAL
jgi:Holliday junction resolvase RusA-like endonuclease